MAASFLYQYSEWEYDQNTEWEYFNRHRYCRDFCIQDDGRNGNCLIKPCEPVNNGTRSDGLERHCNENTKPNELKEDGVKNAVPHEENGDKHLVKDENTKQEPTNDKENVKS